MTSRITTIVESKAFHHIIVAVIELAGLRRKWRDEFRPAVTTRDLEEFVA